MRCAHITRIRWLNPLSHDSSLPFETMLCFPIEEDQIEAFLLEAYGYTPIAFNLDFHEGE